MNRDLALRVTLNLPYEQAVEKAIAALKEEGFGVLTEVDVKATLKKKLGADFREYVILGVCNPPLAHRALTAVLDVGLFLPCNIIVYEEGKQSVVAIIDPLVMMSMLEHPDLENVAQEARIRLLRVIESLAM